jgi:hypothetical protein
MDKQIRLEQSDSLSLYRGKGVAGREYLAIDVVSLASLSGYVAGVVEAFTHLHEKHQGSIVSVCTDKRK